VIGGPVIRVIAGREISERIGSRVLRISTAILTVLVVAGVAVPSLVHGHTSTTRVGLVSAPAQALGPMLAAASRVSGQKLAVTDLADAQTARIALSRGQVDVAVTLTPERAQFEVNESLGSGPRALLGLALQGAHQRQVLSRAGVSTAAIRAAQQPLPITTRALHPPPPDQTARDIAGLASGFLLYITITMYGSAVATGVAQEKTSRTAEVLLACVRPSELLSGKLLGIGVCGLGQLAIPAIAGLIANAVVHSAAIPSTVWVLLPAALLWFVLGYALYAFAFATAGALVARQEEVQFTTGPLAFPLIAGYLLVYAVIGSPHATWLKVLSFLPPLAPSMMPARIAVGGVAWWEVVLAALLTLASIYGMVRLASGIYRTALVRGGARLSWRSALRLRFADREPSVRA
jgi:ABC-2 type transport system permease protein